MKKRSSFNGATHSVPNTATTNGGPEQAAGSLNGHATASETIARRKPPERGQEEMLGVILKMQRDLYEHGKARAIESGALMATDDHLRALENHANAIAREAHREAYNPALHQHDQLLDNEYQKALCDRDEAEHAVKYAQAALRDREEEAAQAHPGDPPKPLGWALPGAAVIAMMITTAPTLHDFVFVMADEFISWLLSVISGLFLGLLVALMILGDSEHSGQRTATNWIGLSAGIFVSLALGALRIKGAESAGDYIFAAAMTALELGIVLGLEGIAMSRRKAHRGWGERKMAADQANARLDVARTHVERCKERLEAINAAIKAHINYVEERGVRFHRIEEISATALEAVRDGYHSGIAENRGRILGIGGKQS
jgi:hypothetical protein